MIYLLLLTLIFIAYPVILMVRPGKEVDKMYYCGKDFSYSSNVSRLDTIERFKGKTYKRQRRLLGYYRQKSRELRRKFSYFETTIDRKFRELVFDQFEDRWIPLKKSDWFMKIHFAIAFLFPMLMAISFILWYVGPHRPNPTEYPLIVGLMSGIVALVPVFLFGLTLLALHSMWLSFVTMIATSFGANNGALQRSNMISEELIRMLKPGGRKTAVNLGSGGAYAAWGAVGISGFGGGSGGGGGFGGGSFGGGGAGGSW